MTNSCENKKMSFDSVINNLLCLSLFAECLYGFIKCFFCNDWIQRKDLDDHNDCCIPYMKHRISDLEVAETTGFTNIPDEIETKAMKR